MLERSRTLGSAAIFVGDHTIKKRRKVKETMRELDTAA